MIIINNVEQFTAGQGKGGNNLKKAFVQFLEGLSKFEGKDKINITKTAPDIQNPLEDAKIVDSVR